MRLLNLSNEKKRDAQVGFESLKEKTSIEMVLPDGSPKQSGRALRATIDTNLEALLKRHGSPAELAQAIINGDPEVDIERFGMFLPKTRRVYLTTAGSVAYCVNLEEVGISLRRTYHCRQARPLNSGCLNCWMNRYRKSCRS